jgi:hypothetical protein
MGLPAVQIQKVLPFNSFLKIKLNPKIKLQSEYAAV